MTPHAALGLALLRPYPLVYLATPYTKNPAGIAAAFVDSAKVAARLVKARVIFYAPIVQCHPIAIFGALDPLDHKIWLPFNEAMMLICPALLVATMDGWHESIGIAHEIDFFGKAGKPIFLIDPHTLELMPYRQDAALAIAHG